MKTHIWQVRSDDPHDPAILEAARLLKAGGIVAFPTETVYGLAANALDANAVARIFEAKGRPSTNPLIVHVASIDAAKELVTEWPETAEKLASTFWPGPLTVVLEKSDVVPSIVTAGGNTIAIRLPAHPVAQALIHACGFPIAAPSANRSNFISPTTAAHVARSLSGRIPLILDGGPCQAGIESTVISLVDKDSHILRPGSLGANELAAVAGIDVRQSGRPVIQGQPTASPGQLPVHYAPDTPLYLAPAGEMSEIMRQFKAAGKRVGLVSLTREQEFPAAAAFVEMPGTAGKYAQRLYAVLHEMDEQDLDVILCEEPPSMLEWQGVRDRLIRAARKA